MTETPEERVRRLRAAHLAARNAQISRFDRIVERSRGVLDTAHRVTIMALLGFTGMFCFLRPGITTCTVVVLGEEEVGLEGSYAHPSSSFRSIAIIV